MECISSKEKKRFGIYWQLTWFYLETREINGSYRLINPHFFYFRLFRHTRHIFPQIWETCISWERQRVIQVVYWEGGIWGSVVSLLRYLEAIYTNAAIYHSYFGYEEPVAVSEAEGK